MNQEQLLKKIKARARAVAQMRREDRFLDVMGFLVTKGFLGANYPLPRRPNKKLFLDDALWAGRNVEPRILEVLPAAVLRLGAHFDFDPARRPELAAVMDALKRGEENGPDFFGVPYAKAREWVNLPLRDGRTKPMKNRKVMKTFRLAPEAAAALKKLAARENCSEAEILERKLLG